MNIEHLIHKIIELNSEIDNDIALVDELEKNGASFNNTDAIEDKISDNLELLDSLKLTLAEKIIAAYTGVDISGDRNAEET